MKKLSFLLVSLSLGLAINAQEASDPVIFEINGKKIFKSEFVKEFMRSSTLGESTKNVAEADKRKALNEYVDLFVNYRVKLEDAYAQEYDKDRELRRELRGYRAELAAPYLIDSNTLNEILAEAYERNHYILRAAHILVRVSDVASPDDTLKAYNTAMDYYNRVTSGNEDFMAVAKEAAEKRFIEDHVDPADPRRSDVGELGCFTVFDMIYPFENAVYALQPGEISKPVRTRYGYHVVKLFSRVPYFGHATMQHIWVANNNSASFAERKINEAYNLIMNGEPFNRVCQNYSEDASTSSNGGLLNDLSIRQLPPEYAERAANMTPGEISKPFHTAYGWHILLLNHRDSLRPFSDMRPVYMQRLSRDNRNLRPRNVFIDQCKEKYNFIDFTTMYEKTPKGKKAPMVRRTLASLDECRAAVNDSVFNKWWHFDQSKITDMRTLFVIADKEYNAVDFMKYIESHQRSEVAYDLDLFIKNRYKEYIDAMVMDYANSHLEQEHPEFAEMMNEYLNGLMIFAYNDKMVWSKAINDTLGQDEFYARMAPTHKFSNPEDAPYFWNTRATVTVVSVSDASVLTKEKAIKLVEKALKKGWSTEQLTANLKKAAKDSEKVTVTVNQVEKEHQNLLNDDQWSLGIYDRVASDGYQLLRVDKVEAPCLKTKMEARGYYISDYQNYLEKQLTESLRKKYNVKIKRDVVDSITF